LSSCLGFYLRYSFSNKNGTLPNEFMLRSLESAFLFFNALRPDSVSRLNSWKIGFAYSGGNYEDQPITDKYFFDFWSIFLDHSFRWSLFLRFYFFWLQWRCVELNSKNDRNYAYFVSINFSNFWFFWLIKDTRKPEEEVKNQEMII